MTYGDGSHDFWLRSEATLAEIAARVSVLDLLHADTALTIDIAFTRHLRPDITFALAEASTKDVRKIHNQKEHAHGQRAN